MFDPWKANTTETEEAQAAWLASGNKNDPRDPVSQFWAVVWVSASRVPITVSHTAGGPEILECVGICMRHGIIAPEWLSLAFDTCFNAVANFQAKSWDDPIAFGAPFEKGTQIAALRKAKEKGPKVCEEVNSILKSEPKTSIDKHLFERVGEKLGLGVTLTEEFYYFFRTYVPDRKRKQKMAVDDSPAESTKLAGIQKKRL